MEEEIKIDTEKSRELCLAFVEACKKGQPNIETTLHATTALFVGMLRTIVIPDPDTGRKTESILSVAPGLIISYIKDYPVDE